MTKNSNVTTAPAAGPQQGEAVAWLVRRKDWPAGKYEAQAGKDRPTWADEAFPLVHPAPAVERGVEDALQTAGLPSLEESAKCDAAQAIFWRNLNGGPISAQDAYRAGWFGHAALTATKGTK